jgi:hypothetical protein
LGKKNETFRELIGILHDLYQRKHLLMPDLKGDYTPSAGLIAHRHVKLIIRCLAHLELSQFNLHSFNIDLIKSLVVIYQRDT